jgi:uncharacterized damage-inducible protein DinB
MKLSDLNDLYGHMEWADACVWRAVQDCESAAADQKLRDLFYHLHLVQRAFLGAWRGQPRDSPTFDDVKSIMQWGHSYHVDVSSYLEALTDEQIAETLLLPWAEIVERELGRKPEKISVAETMLQVTLHSQYHRGQINARLRAIGGEPPRVDYIIWLWLGRPAADWKFLQTS